MLIERTTLENLRVAENLILSISSANGLLKAFDADATSHKYAKELRAIPQSEFGRVVLEVDREKLMPQYTTFDCSPCDLKDVCGEAPHGSDDEKELEAVKAQKRRVRDGFLLAVVKAVLPLYVANRCSCPYMPRNWIDNYLRNQLLRSPQETMSYLEERVKELAAYLGGYWSELVIQTAEEISPEAAEQLVYFLDMFLEASEGETLVDTKAWEKNLPKKLLDELSGIINEFGQLET